MAPSDGITAITCLTRTTRRVASLAVGEFGEYVALRLSEIRSDVGTVKHVAEIESATSLLVLALWRPDFALAAAVQRQAHAVGVAMLPVVFDGRAIRVGPVARADRAGCVTCLRGRLEQHASHEETIRYAAQIDRDPSFGLRGFLPHHVSAASAITSTVISAALSSPDSDSLIHTLQVDRLEISQNRLLALPGCPDCTAPAAMPLALAVNS